MSVMKLMAVTLAGWINRQQQPASGVRRGGELLRAAWRIASLLLPGRGMNATIRVFGHCAATDGLAGTPDCAGGG